MAPARENSRPERKVRTIFKAIKTTISNRLWVPPLITGIIGAVAAWFLAGITLDPTSAFSNFLWPGDTSAAASMLGFVASSMLTVLTTTVSMTLIVLQVASGSFSHQLLRNYIQSRAIKGIFAVFIGVFVYALVLQRSVSAEARETAPQLGMTVALLLVFSAIGTFVWYISAVVRMVRVDAIIERVAERATKLMRAHREEWPEANEVPEIPNHAVDVRGHTSGYVRSVATREAALWAQEHEVTVVFTVAPGDTVSAGQTLAWLWNPDAGEARPELREEDLDEFISTYIQIEAERVSDQDIRLSLHQLADIGVRSLSPGSNDPTTGVHVIAQATPVLRRLVSDPLQNEVVFDDAGTARAVVATPTVRDFLVDFVVPLRRYCSTAPEVTIELLRLLVVIEEGIDDSPGVKVDDLAGFVDSERQQILEGAKQGFVHQADLELLKPLLSVEGLRSTQRVKGPAGDVIEESPEDDA